MNELSITFIAFGHKNIRATHKTTLEITKESDLTIKGDCIIGVNADIACYDIPKHILEAAKSKDCIIKLILEINGKKEIITGRGDPRLTYKNKISFVVRKSNFVCDRTLMINADKSARDLDRSFIEELKDEKSKILGKIIYIY